MVCDGALGDGILALPLLGELCAGGPGLALIAGPLARWWAELGWPVARVDAPQWLPLWSAKAASEALLGTLGSPEHAVVVGQPLVADALEAAGLSVRRVPVTPPPGVHQAAWLLGRVIDPASVAVPLLRVTPACEEPQTLLFPGSGGLHKCWPAARYAELGRALVHAGRRVAVVLGPVELERGPGPEVFGGLTVLQSPDLATTAALCAGSVLVVGNDAGTTHLAAVCGARVLALFGPTDPERWRPLGPRVRVLRAPLEALSVEAVLEAC